LDKMDPKTITGFIKKFLRDIRVWFKYTFFWTNNESYPILGTIDSLFFIQRILHGSCQ
jgi:hypothetical protein